MPPDIEVLNERIENLKAQVRDLTKGIKEQVEVNVEQSETFSKALHDYNLGLTRFETIFTKEFIKEINDTIDLVKVLQANTIWLKAILSLILTALIGVAIKLFVG